MSQRPAEMCILCGKRKRKGPHAPICGPCDRAARREVAGWMAGNFVENGPPPAAGEKPCPGCRELIRLEVSKLENEARLLRRILRGRPAVGVVWRRCDACERARLEEFKEIREKARRAEVAGRRNPRRRSAKAKTRTTKK
jgi:hypothetical protein